MAAFIFNGISFIASILSIATFILAIQIKKKISIAADKGALSITLDGVTDTIRGYLSICKQNVSSLNAYDLLDSLVNIKECYVNAYDKRTIEFFDQAIHVTKTYIADPSNDPKGINLTEALSALIANIEKDGRTTWTQN